MKKVLAVLLATALMFTLAACGTAAAAPTATPVPATDAPTVEPTVEPTPEPTAEPTPTEEPAALSRGAVSGNVYTNTYFGISCQLNETWTFATEEALLEMAGLTAEALNDEELAAQLENSGVIYDMYAMSDQGKRTINITLQEIGAVGSLLISEAAYLDASVDQTVQALASAGFENVATERRTATLAGVERESLLITGVYSGMDVTEEIVCVKRDKYMACITFCCFGEDTLADMQSCFSVLPE